MAPRAGTGGVNVLKMVRESMGSPHVSSESELAPGRQQSLLSDKVNHMMHKPLTFDISQAD